MAVVLPDRQVIITAAPGTGSTSLVVAARQVPGSSVVPEMGNGATTVSGVDPKHARVEQLVAAGLLPEDHGLTIVTTVRNPFDYWPSEWLRTRTRWIEELRRPDSWVYRQTGMVDRIVDAATMDFGSWLRHVLAANADSSNRQHLNQGHVREADIVLRTEHLADDAAAAFGPNFPPVPHVNRTPGRAPYWTYYDEETRAIVASVFQPTLTRFGYRF